MTPEKWHFAIDTPTRPWHFATIATDGAPHARPLADRLANIPPLARGAHRNIEAGACVMEAASYIAGEPWSHHPVCACPVITTFLISWNDALQDDERDALLRPYIARVVNTRDTPDIERRRSMLAADWLIREYTPAWLRLAGLTKQADLVAALPEITDLAQCPSLMPALKAVRDDAYVARAAAGDAAGAVARAAAGAAAWDAAWNALVPTRKALQQSACLLLDRMIDCGAVA